MATGGRGSQSDTPRRDKSLGLLTSKFVALLQDSPDGVLDLKQVISQAMLLEYGGILAHRRHFCRVSPNLRPPTLCK